MKLCRCYGWLVCCAAVATVIVLVSARQHQARVLLQEQSWKLTGIANGIDYSEWHPKHDGCLTSDGYIQVRRSCARPAAAALPAASSALQLQCCQLLLCQVTSMHRTVVAVTGCGVAHQAPRRASRALAQPLSPF